MGSGQARPGKRTRPFPAASNLSGAQSLTGIIGGAPRAELQRRFGKPLPRFAHGIEAGRVLGRRGGAGVRVPGIFERVIVEMRVRAGAEDLHQHHAEPGQQQQADDHLCGREFLCPLQHVHSVFLSSGVPLIEPGAGGTASPPCCRKITGSRPLGTTPLRQLAWNEGRNAACADELRLKWARSGRCKRAGTQVSARFPQMRTARTQAGVAGASAGNWLNRRLSG
jgi:hypothetical protein